MFRWFAKEWAERYLLLAREGAWMQAAPLRETRLVKARMMTWNSGGIISGRVKWLKEPLHDPGEMAVPNYEEKLEEACPERYGFSGATITKKRGRT